MGDERERSAMNALSEPLYVTHAQRWEAVRTRDAAADGRFFCCVLSTGIFCYPSCSARPARPENVVFHTDREAAIAAGFRACKRCRPELPPRAVREADLVARACRSIEAAEQGLSLDELADAAGVSPFHFHRLFRRIVGVTPKAYAADQRAGRVRRELAGGGSVTSAIYDAGFNSSGRFYEAAGDMLGMTPSAFRAGGAGERIGFASGACSLGCVLVAATARGVCAILLGDDAEVLEGDLRQRFPRATLQSDAGFGAWLDAVIAGIDIPGRGFGLPLDIRGTAFQRLVWEQLRAIPLGETRSYREIAERLGQPRAVRAVAGACKANPLAVAVPCHRVIGSDGALTGYRWGVARKQALLARERKAGAEP